MPKRLFLFFGMHFFFSDVHLGLGSPATSRAREHEVVRFLEYVGTQNAESLWIVGDLFDYWFDYRHVIPRAFVRTLGAIAALSDAGVRIEYVIGNHDFGHKNFFEQELGVHVHVNDVEREIAGRRMLISHGDGKALNDRGYLILKKVLRARATNALWRLLHPDLGIGLASRASHRSRAHTEEKYYGGERPGESDGLERFARTTIESGGVDLVVMGHIHSPRIVPMGAGTYINLGSWMGEEKRYLVVDETGWELKAW